MQQIGILCAMRREAQFLINHFSLEPISSPLGEVGISIFKGKQILLVITGVGISAGSAGFYVLLYHLKKISRGLPYHIFNIGTCGSRDPRFSIGSIAQPTVFKKMDFDLGTYGDGLKDPMRINSSSTKDPVILYSLDSFCDSPPEDILEPFLVDMEAYSIMSLIRTHNLLDSQHQIIPHIYKIISDYANQDASIHFQTHSKTVIASARQALLLIVQNYLAELDTPE